MDKGTILKKVNLLQNDIHDAQKLCAVSRVFEIAIRNSKAEIGNAILLPAISSIAEMALVHHEQLKKGYKSLLSLIETDNQDNQIGG